MVESLKGTSITELTSVTRSWVMLMVHWAVVIVVLIQVVFVDANEANDNVARTVMQNSVRHRFHGRNMTKNSAGEVRPRSATALVPGSSNWTMDRVAKNPSTSALITKLRSMHIQTNPLRTHREPIPNNTNVMEVMMMRREMETFSRTLEQMKARNYVIKGFYHTSAWQTFWKEVISEQLLLLDGKRKIPISMDYENKLFEWDRNHTWASLLNASESLYLNVAGPDISDLAKIQEVAKSLNLENAAKIEWNFNATVGRGHYNGATEEQKAVLMNNTLVSEGEYSTVMALQRYCKKMTREGKKAVVYYMHNKGGCCFKRNSNERMPVHAWRDAMNAMIVEFPSICTRALMKGYSTCGAENQDGHFSGNFWWAECEHVAHIGPLTTRFDAWAAEYFVMKVNPHNGGVNKRFGYQCGYSVHNCGLNLYDKECLRDFYREKLYRYTSGKLGPNMVATTVNDTSLCREVRKRPYSEQADYLDKHLLHENVLHGGPAHRRRLVCVADDY